MRNSYASLTGKLEGKGALGGLRRIDGMIILK
jgi:hypothetical protein